MGYFNMPSNFFEMDEIKRIDAEENPDIVVRFLLWLILKAKQNPNTKHFEYRVKGVSLTNNNLSVLSRMKEKEVIYSIKVLLKHKIIKRSEACINIQPFWVDIRDRTSAIYRKWRLDVFKRDDFTCRICGAKRDLQAHHIIHWADTADNKDLRYDINNGITLCKKCHLEAHNGSWRK